MPIMKCLLTILSIFLYLQLSATDYYIASNGNDTNNGTSTGTAWQTLSKVNATTFSAGDKILFRKGDTFYGRLEMQRNGTVADSIYYGAYGTGAKPIITGFVNVTSWSNLGSNIWESTNAVSTLSKLRVVVVNGVNTPMGRYPNGDATYPFLPNYLKYATANNANNTVTGPNLISGTNWTGAELVIRQNQWTIEKSRVTAHSGSTVTHSGVPIPLDANWGVFFQDDPRTLDVQNEWYYNPSTKKIRIYSTSQPSGVRVSTIDTLINSVWHTPTNSYIVMQDLVVEGANENLLSWNGTGRSRIYNCEFNYAGLHAVLFSGNSYVILDSNYVRDAGENGLLHSNGGNLTITNNTFLRSGIVTSFPQMQHSGGAMALASPSSLVQYNSIDSSEYCGMHISGQNITIRNNFIRHGNMSRGDGGGIYLSNNTLNTIINGNIVLNSIGNARGTDSEQVEGYGIYLDDMSAQSTVTNNTIAGCAGTGLFFHNTFSNKVHDNTIYNNGGSSSWAMNNIFVQNDENAYTGVPFNGLARDNIVTRNIVFAVGNSINTQGVFRYYCANTTNLVNDFGVIDSNYYAKPLHPNSAMQSWQNSSTITYMNLADWKTLAEQDANSVDFSSQVGGSLNNVRLEYNASNAPKMISLDANYVDVKNTLYNGSITLQPWASAVLIYESGLTNPISNAGPDQTVNINVETSALLEGSAIPGASPIASVLWVKKSGPSGGTIQTPTNLTTSINTLQIGTYVYELTVTDENSLTGSDEITIDVYANQPPVISMPPNRTIQIPSTDLSATVTPDAGTTITGQVWSVISGSGTFTAPTSLTTTINGLATGVNILQLTATQSDSQIANGYMSITVTDNPSSGTLKLRGNIKFKNINPNVN